MRYLWAGSAAVLVAAVGVATVVPVASTLSVVPETAAARYSVVCPSFDPTVGSVNVAAGAAEGTVRVATVAEPDTADTPEGVVVKTDAKVPVLVSGTSDIPFGATTAVSAGEGGERGLSLVGCSSPATQQWFSGALLNRNAELELTLSNTDATAAAVDVTVIGPDGVVAVPGSRGIEVAAHSTSSVKLQAGDPIDGPVSVEVTTTVGRVATALRQRVWQGESVLGAEWLPQALGPANEQVIAVVPTDVAGQLVLAVTNPGDRAASVQIDLLTTGGATTRVGLESLDVPAGTTRTLELAEAFGSEPAAIRLRSEAEIVAGVRGLSVASEGKQDLLQLAGGAALNGTGYWPIPAQKSAKSVLWLANPAAEQATVSVTLGDQLGGPGKTESVTVPAESVTSLDLPAAEVNTVQLSTEADTVRASVVTRRTLGKLKAIGTLTLLPSAQKAELPLVDHDPLVGAPGSHRGD